MKASLFLIAPLLLVGCSAYDLASEKASDTGEADGDIDDVPHENTDSGGSDTEDTTPPEQEQDFLMLQPAATNAYVFVVNPDRNTVSRVSVPSLEVVTTEVGVSPQEVRTTADYAKAITFNTGSDDVSIIEAATLEVTNLAVRPNLNAMAMSPDGRWVVCFHDADVAGEDDEGGVQSFNEISVVDTEAIVQYPQVVGSNARQVKFTDDSRYALVVSDKDLAIIDLQDPGDAPNLVQLAEDPLNPLSAEEVEVAPDNSYAFVRQFGADEIVVVNLASLEVGRVTVGRNPTDLDLLADGSKAVVVSRDDAQVWMLDVADPFLPATIVPLPVDETLGSVILSSAGDVGILYTTALLTDRYASWDIASGEVTVRELVKPVQSMAISPTGGTLLVFHTFDDASDGSTQETYRDAWAMTLMDLSDFRENALKLAGEPMAYSHSDDGTHGYFIQEAQPYLDVLDYDTLIPEDILLKSNPLHVGALPGTSFAYVSQEHELGRISFYDTQTGLTETITGFELNSEIEH